MTGDAKQAGGGRLELSVGDEFREKVCRCRKQQCCLEGATESLCRVIDCVAEKVFFVHGEDGHSCSYCLSFGDSHYCNCPVRQELYRKYKI